LTFTDYATSNEDKISYANALLELYTKKEQLKHELNIIKSDDEIDELSNALNELSVKYDVDEDVAILIYYDLSDDFQKNGINPKYKRDLEGLFTAYENNIAPTKSNVANRTRSKRQIDELAEYEQIPPPKRGTDIISMESTKQGVPRITLSDGKEYTLDEIKDMWKYSKVQTPLRHPYTEEDKQKIQDFINFAKGGKRRRKQKRTKTRRTKKLKK